jgi:hypothetical protein
VNTAIVWSNTFDLAFNSPYSSCGCTNFRALNYKSTASIDDSSCVFSKCAFVTCPGPATAKQCLKTICDEVDGICKTIEASVNDLQSCSDGFSYTVNDTCALLPGSPEIFCYGTDVCANNAEAYCARSRTGDNYCSVLRDCIEGICTWDFIPDNTPCESDALPYTTEKCLSGHCTVTLTERCLHGNQGINLLSTVAIPQRTLHMYESPTCKLYWPHVVEVGDVISFSLFTFSKSHFGIF